LTFIFNHENLESFDVLGRSSMSPKTFTIQILGKAKDQMVTALDEDFIAFCDRPKMNLLYSSFDDCSQCERRPNWF
jgi:hypothetical protein